MPVQLTFSNSTDEESKDVLVAFSDRRITEKGEAVYNHNQSYALHSGDRPWLKDVVEAILVATDLRPTVTVRPRTIAIVAKKPISKLDRSKFENAVQAAIQKHGIPVLVEA